jgi:hypothetical protein
MHDGESTSVTMPEITLKLQQLTEDSKVGIRIPAKSFNKPETLGGIQKAWHKLQQWILYSDCCSTLKMAVPQSTTFLHQAKVCVGLLQC